MTENWQTSQGYINPHFYNIFGMKLWNITTFGDDLSSCDEIFCLLCKWSILGISTANKSAVF